MQKRKKSRYGFTLLEMTIVLAIVGLLTGGILAGQSLLRQSQINSAMTDAQRYITATVNFRQKYNALPGDFASATSYWGAMSSCPPADASATQGGTLTCNGNGDGIIGRYNGIGAYQETFYFWQHLANAQLIQGNYTGIPGSVSSPNIIGADVPAGRLPGIGFSMYYFGSINISNIVNVLFYPNNFGHVLLMGNISPPYLWTSSPVMTPQEAQSFDGKYDDGLPGSGNVQTFGYGNAVDPFCATSTLQWVATYNTNTANANSTGLQCSLILITGF